MQLEKLKCDSVAGQPLCDDLSYIDIDQPKWDQSTYMGRAKHFLTITNPLNIFASSASLENAKCIVSKFRCREMLPECLTAKDLWNAKHLYDSAYHPDTGEKMSLIGRMSAQVPMNMLITGGMLTFYKSTPAVIFWQWINQSFNALVNYTNRSGDAKIGEKQLLVSYVAATTGAVVTALTLNRLVRNMPPLVGRFVPFAAVAAANMVNIPCMRSYELKNGTPIFDENNCKLGNSKVAAQEGIKMCLISRIAMAAPGMLLVPVIMNHFERRGTLCRYPWINLPMQVALLGFFLTFATPLACAFFKQRAELRFCDIEPEVRDKIFQRALPGHIPKVVYYNKGL